MQTLNVGTKEIIVLQLADRISSISDLGPYVVEQKILTEDESDTKQDWTVVENVSLMEVHALVDTTSWDEGTYKLYLRLTIPPELPVLGPFEIEVS